MAIAARVSDMTHGLLFISCANLLKKKRCKLDIELFFTYCFFFEENENRRITFQVSILNICNSNSLAKGRFISFVPNGVPLIFLKGNHSKQEKAIS